MNDLSPEVYALLEGTKSSAEDLAAILDELDDGQTCDLVYNALCEHLGRTGAAQVWTEACFLYDEAHDVYEQ